MSTTQEVEFQQATSTLDGNELSNTELETMLANSSHNHRTLEEIINKYDSPNINLSHQQLTDDNLSIIINFALIKKKCIELKLGYNNITSNGIEILAHALCTNKSLERLNLFNNKVSDQGVLYLTKILSLNNSDLKILFLGQNQITDIGAEYLSEMLKTNKTLIQLGLSNN